MTLPELRSHLRPPGPVLDLHTHPNSGLGLCRPASPEEDARCLLAAAERAGVAKIAVSSLTPGCPYDPTPEQFRAANEEARALRDAAPDRILPFCYVSPAFPEAAVAEIDRCVRQHRFCGIKLWVARRATDPGLDAILRRAAELGVPVLQHAWIKTTGNLEGESFPSDVADLARRHPQAQIIMAHLNGCGLRGMEEVADCPNVAIDTSGGDPESGVVEAAVERLGRHRIVFGSDAPGRHFAVQLAKVLGADLPDAIQRDILWNNAARLLPEWAGVRAGA